jgi:hypothetical protein
VIVWSMIQESTLATAAGGLIACAVGVFLLDGLAVRFSMGAFGLVIDETVIGLGLLTGLALGVVGALPPGDPLPQADDPRRAQGGVMVDSVVLARRVPHGAEDQGSLPRSFDMKTATDEDEWVRCGR